MSKQDTPIYARVANTILTRRSLLGFSKCHIGTSTQIPGAPIISAAAIQPASPGAYRACAVLRVSGTHNAARPTIEEYPAQSIHNVLRGNYYCTPVRRVMSLLARALAMASSLVCGATGFHGASTRFARTVMHVRIGGGILCVDIICVTVGRPRGSKPRESAKSNAVEWKT